MRDGNEVLAGMEQLSAPGNGHLVLGDPATGALVGLDDIEASASLRRVPVPRSQREAFGRSLRRYSPLAALGDWHPEPGRRDPVSQLQALHQGRLRHLVPVRVGRMLASPYGFLRGAAVVMAADLSAVPATGILPVICGDAHIGNFGCYGSPERDLVLDLNDFDEAHPGSWEWDVRRLAASIWVAGRQGGLHAGQCADAARSATAAYRQHLRELASQPLLTRSFQPVRVDGLGTGASGKALRKEIKRAARKARHRTSETALPRFTEEHGGERRIVEEAPLITRLPPAEADQLAGALDGYLGTLPPHWQRVAGGYSIRDIAFKVVGLGSVGLRAYIVLCEGIDPGDVLFLQVKEARRSVVAPYVHGELAWHAHQGQRVVEYQQALQAVSDPLLGWLSHRGHQYYVRQFRNMKGSVSLDGLKADALASYAAICGQLLARAHARTAGASLIAGYLGTSDEFDQALCHFGRAYADQTERDHEALVRAVRSGRIAADPAA